MTTPDLILSILRTHHRGKENAITREAFRDKLKSYGIDIDDRTYRQIYSSLPICTCSRGAFVPNVAQELWECREYYRKVALSLLGRWQRVADAHPELINTQQKELFI